MTTRQNHLAQRRERLIRDVELEFGIRMYPGRQRRVVIVSESDHRTLLNALFTDRYSPIARGYYLGLGGEVDVVTAPDWTCDPMRVAEARWVVVLLQVLGFRRLIRWLEAALAPRGGRRD